MLISQNGETGKTDNSSTKMNSGDLNNADGIKEKANSLNAQKIKNINNLMQSQDCDEKDKKFCNDELKKHVSILCEYFLVTKTSSDVHNERSFSSSTVGKQRRSTKHFQ